MLSYELSLCLVVRTAEPILHSPLSIHHSSFTTHHSSPGPCGLDTKLMRASSQPVLSTAIHTHYIYIHIVCVCVCVCMFISYGTHVESEDNLQEFVFSFYHVTPGN